MKSLLRLQRTSRDNGSGLGLPQDNPSLIQLPIDTLENICHFLEVKDVSALGKTCKTLRDVARTPTVWANLMLRSFAIEELPQDLGFLRSKDTAVLQSQFRKLTLQRPAFLSDAPRTSEILEHTGSRFRMVLHIDGRRDLNFTTVFRAMPPGQYNVVWRLMLQPGYVRGYCNFRAVFARPANSRAAAKAQAKALARIKAAAAANAQQLSQHPQKQRRPFGSAAGLKRRVRSGKSADDTDAGVLRGQGPQGVPRHLEAADGEAVGHKWRLRPHLRWLPTCLMSRGGVAPHDPNDPDGLDGAYAGALEQFGVAAAVEAAAMAAAAGAAKEAELGQASAAGASASRAPPAHAGGAGIAPGQPPPQAQLHQDEQAAGGLEQEQLGFAEALGLSHPEIEPVPQTQPAPQSGLQLQTHSQRQLLDQQQQPVQARQAASEAAPAQHDPVAVVPRVPAPPQQQAPQLQLQRAMGQLASVSAKRDAALAGSSGSRYVPRWLAPLWGSHACSWRQLDPAGPVGRAAWRTVHMGTVTVRRCADVHLHGVMVQLRPTNAEQQRLALPAGETRWRGALVDYVELVPARDNGLLEGLVPSFLHSLSPVFPELEDVVALPKV